MNCLQARLTSAIQGAINNQIEVSKIVDQIKTRIIDKINQLSFDDAIRSFNEKVDDAHKAVMQFSER